MFRRLAFLYIFLAATTAWAQSPDKHGEVALDQPRYQGTTANAPIPPELHIRNEGGSDGAGLCVISSILANGMYQGVPGLEGGKRSTLWRDAKSRPGGYYPGKLEDLLKRTMPGEKWFSWEGDGTDLVAAYSAKGFPIGATMNTGALYGYQPIHHMISVIHLDDSWACVVDNNDPGKYHWMPRREYDRRFVDGKQGWGFVWLRDPVAAGGDLLILASVLMVAACVLIVHGSSPGVAA